MKDELNLAGVSWPLHCVCGEPVVLMDRTESAQIMRTGCCGARYQWQGPGRLSCLDDGWVMGAGSKLPEGVPAGFEQFTDAIPWRAES